LPNLHVTKARTNILVLSADKNFLIGERLGIRKNADLQIAATVQPSFEIARTYRRIKILAYGVRGLTRQFHSVYTTPL